MRLIDADELMEKANEHYRLALKRTEEAPFNDRYREQTIEREKFLGFIGNAPTVPNEYMRGYEAAKREYKRPQGEWIELETDPPDFFGHRFFSCSKCGREIDVMTPEETLSDYPYCHCGADMRGGRQ